MLPATRHRLLWLGLFAFAMAQLEATVVVYLRELFYPEGFAFPLVIIEGRIAAIEIGREAATVLMLVAVAVLSSPDRWRRWAAFLFSFGLWDLFYYLWLYIMLGWPTHWLEWDVLFLIPLPWLGPWIAPALIAVVMVAAALGIEWLRDRGRAIQVRRPEWGVVVGSAVALLVIFMLDAGAVVSGEMPGPFPWPAYGLCLLAAVAATLRAARRSAAGPDANSR